MTNSALSVPLSRSRDIPFNKLILSQSNVRQVNAGVSIEDLSEDIGRRGLLTALNVRPVLDGEGAETGTYEIPAGGRRYRALERLVKAKRLKKDALVPCVIGDSSAGTSQEDDSLAENTHRVALHPLDQYRAFLALRRQDMSEEDIAARYFVTVAVVKQRLRLAAVSPVLLDLYAKDELTLDQLTAFSVTGDHPRQEQVWEVLKDLPNTWQKNANAIRNHLTQSAVAANDRRAVFVGLDVYEGAGGEVLRDLFSADNGGWLQDAGLLDRLVGEKLQDIAGGLKTEGWKWIELMPSLPFDHLYGMRQLKPVVPALSEDDQTKLDALKAEHLSLEEAFEDYEELPEKADRRLGEIEAEIEALEGEGDPVFDPVEVVRAGAVVSIDRAGAAQILRGYVRPEDEVVPETTAKDGEGIELSTEGPRSPVPTAVISLGAAEPPAEQPTEEEDVLRPLPERLVIELTAFRTVALRDAVAGNPHIALTLLLHKLATDLFHRDHSASCLQVSVIRPNLHTVAPKDLNETIPVKSMDDRHERWADTLPGDSEGLWTWLDQADDFTRVELLAYCVSFGVNALMERPNLYGGYPTQGQVERRLKSADKVAQTTRLDLVGEGWRPTADTYLNRVPRPRILEAVREGCGERQAQMIDHLKKGDMVIEAERLLTDSGWLPEPLRLPVEASRDAEEQALPAFLLGEGGAEPDAETAIAAE
jgi:ParB family chromosome partitioning protein